MVGDFDIHYLTNVQGRVMEGFCKFVDLACYLILASYRGSHRLLHYLHQLTVLLPVVGCMRDTPPLECGLLRLRGFLNLIGPPLDLLVDESLSWLGRTKALSHLVKVCLSHICQECFDGLVVINGDNVGVEHGSCPLRQVPTLDLLRNRESGAGPGAEVQQEVKD